MKIQFFVVLAFVTFLSGCNQSFQDSSEIADLSGRWKFQLDPDNIGLNEQWYMNDLKDSVTLPGTTDENKKGIYKDERAVDRLSRIWYSGILA